MNHRKIVKALRDKGLTWEQIGPPCEVCARTAQNWGTMKHSGPGPAAMRLLKQLALREEVL
jgi:hypothetical protein